MKLYSWLLKIPLVIMILIIPFQVGMMQTIPERTLVGRAERITGDRFPFTTTTSQGVKIYSVGRISFEMMKAIDQGFDDLFTLARNNNFRRRLNHSDYSVFIAKADRKLDSSKRYSPDIAVAAAQYAGTEYDQGGFIYAAGLVLSNYEGAFIIAEHEKDFERVADVVRFEGEHIVLYHNDRKRYLETADHSSGGGHPILD